MSYTYTQKIEVTILINNEVRSDDVYSLFIFTWLLKKTLYVRDTISSITIEIVN